MEAKTSAALEASIKHWERNVAAELPTDVHTGGDACALCDKFQDAGNCAGCPVFQFTKQHLCRKTPYGAAAAAAVEWTSFGGASARKHFRIAAQAELDFLISLREPAPQELREAAS